MTDILPRAEKRCPRCKTIKPASDFGRSDRAKDGLAAYCKSCLWQYVSRDKTPPPDGYKKCSSCQQIKPLEVFFNDKSTKDGRGYECKPCHKERMNRIVSEIEPTGERIGSKRGMTFRRRPIEDLPDDYKRCLKCDEVKPASAFPKRAKSSDGLNSHCKECENKRRKRLPIIIPETKQCKKCGESKPAEEFYLSLGKKSSGLDSWCKECRKPYARERRSRSYSYIKDRRTQLRSFYGMTLEEYEEMLQAQEGKCASCGQPETTMMRGKIVPLAVDHSRTTGAVRGLLCRRCNQALGMLYEDPERAEGLLKYIQERVLY